jgi:hypothetical protein
MVSYDVTDDSDPAIAEQITQIHKARYEGDEALSQLVSSLKTYSGSSHPS